MLFTFYMNPFAYVFILFYCSCLLVVQLLQGVVLSTFIVAISEPQMLGKGLPSDIVGISTTTVAVDSVDTQTTNPLLYYVVTTDQGN